MCAETLGGEGRIRFGVKHAAVLVLELINDFMLQIAAQNCRKRKVEQIYSLEEELNYARVRKKEILSERAELLRRQQEGRARLARLERAVLGALGKAEAGWRLEADLATGRVSFIQRPLSERSACNNYPISITRNKDI